MNASISGRDLWGTVGALKWERRGRRGGGRVGNHSPGALCRLFLLLFHLRRQGGIVLRLTAPSFIELSNKSEEGGKTEEGRRSQVKALSEGALVCWGGWAWCRPGCEAGKTKHPNGKIMNS